MGWGSKGRQLPRRRGGFSGSYLRIVKLLKSNSSSVEQTAISFTAVNRRFKARIVVLIEELCNKVG